MHYCTSFKEQDKIEHFRCCLRLRKKFSRIFFPSMWFLFFLASIAFFFLSPTTKTIPITSAIIDDTITWIIAQMENARLDRFNTELQNDPHAAVPEELTKRCLKTINAHFSNMRRSSSLRIVKKAINLAAILIAISDEFRTATLNLVITANEKYTQLKMKQEDSPQESGNSMVTDNNEFFKNIRLAWLPDGYEYLSGEYDYQAIFANDENNWIIINRFDGTSTYNVDTEGAEIVEEIMINGNSGLRIVKNDQTHIALANTDKNIFIDICSSEHVPGEVVEKIAQNIFVID